MCRILGIRYTGILLHSGKGAGYCSRQQHGWGSHGHCAEYKKPGSEDCILWDTIYITFWVKQLNNRSVVARI